MNGKHRAPVIVMWTDPSKQKPIALMQPSRLSALVAKFGPQDVNTRSVLCKQHRSKKAEVHGARTQKSCVECLMFNVRGSTDLENIVEHQRLDSANSSI